ncbi:hypothetical protein M422DRAFT_25262 [Sphaerobolus stellatus SS14]|nr:hypothetical protein M422DRAFT_25262 [Sphaerobolus stellatus SS14]
MLQLFWRNAGAQKQAVFVSNHICRRYKHGKAHRMVDVKLLENIPGVGMKGTIQSVAPGRMRHAFYPEKKAAYILRDGTSAPQSPRTETASQKRPSPGDTIDMVKIRSQLRDLGTLVFHRRLSASNNGADASDSLSRPETIEDPITLRDVRRVLQRKLGLSNLPDVGELLWKDEITRQRIETFGEHPVILNCQRGDIFTINVHVQPQD